GVKVPTAHRWFVRWTEAGLWARIHHAVLDELGSQGLIDWSRAVVDAAHVRAKKGGPMTGPSPVDREKPGSKLHVLSPTPLDYQWPPGSRRPTRLMATRRSRWSTRPRRSVPDVGRGAASRRRCMATRLTTAANVADGYETGKSGLGWHARISSPRSASAATGGSSNAPWPGSPATAA